MRDTSTISKKHCGFTVLELAVLVGILAGVGVLAAPSLVNAHRSAYRRQCQTNLRQLGVAFSLYTTDSGGILPWSWTFTRDVPIGTNAGFQIESYFITGTGLPYSETSGLPALGANTFAIWYYPYLRDASVFTCPTQFQIQHQNGVTNPRAFHLDAPAPALIYNHYRQNPYFGHEGYGPGNKVELAGEITSWTSQYRVQATLTDVEDPGATILNFDVSPYRWETPYVCSPACAVLAPSSSYLGGDRTLTNSYSNAAFTPNIGFLHGNRRHDRGNFSFIDGHVQLLDVAILADTNDTYFTLRK